MVSPGKSEKDTQMSLARDNGIETEPNHVTHPSLLMRYFRNRAKTWVRVKQFSFQCPFNWGNYQGICPHTFHILMLWVEDFFLLPLSSLPAPLHEPSFASPSLLLCFGPLSLPSSPCNVLYLPFFFLNHDRLLLIIHVSASTSLFRDAFTDDPI